MARGTPKQKPATFRQQYVAGFDRKEDNPMAAHPKILAKKVKTHEMANGFRQRAPQQRLERPRDRLNKSGQPIIKEAQIQSSAPLLPGPASFGAGAPLF